MTEPESCGSCRFWDSMEVAHIGYCRRFPPVPSDGILAEHPRTDSRSWCGEWRTKLTGVADG